MKIAIISAMTEEIQPIIDNENFQQIGYLNGNEVYKHNTLDIYLLNSGIGKVNATLTTTLLIEKYQVDYIINIGTAGGIKGNSEVLDIIVGNEISFWDVDASAFDYQIGQYPKEEKSLTIKQANDVYSRLNKKFDNVKLGAIVTGDVFVSKPEQIEYINKHFDNVLAVEMETAAIIMTAQKLDVDAIVIRTISDVIGSDNHIDFKKYINIASKQYLDILKDII